jgi:hypothetical protein
LIKACRLSARLAPIGGWTTKPATVMDVQHRTLCFSIPELFHRHAFNYSQPSDWYFPFILYRSGQVRILTMCTWVWKIENMIVRLGRVDIRNWKLIHTISLNNCDWCIRCLLVPLLNKITIIYFTSQIDADLKCKNCNRRKRLIYKFGTRDEK